MHYIYNDGGRAAAGYRGPADDCVTRAIAIAAQLPYREVYDAINLLAKDERYKRGRVGTMFAIGRGSSARTGVLKPTWKAYLRSLGWTWTATMRVGTGCRVHLRDGELPARGRLVVSVSKHLVAVVDNTIYDTHDPSRGGTRCVYGYWQKDRA